MKKSKTKPNQEQELIFKMLLKFSELGFSIQFEKELGDNFETIKLIR